jgi:hypothetical protein
MPGMMKLPMEGGCRCDQVRIRVTQAPMMTFACHCPGCQRMSSSAYSLTAMFLADAFAVTRGDVVVGGLHRQEAQHMFCAHCMTWMFTRPAVAPHVVNVRPTMLDDYAWFAVFVESYARTKLPWAATGAFHSFEEFPPMESYERLIQEYTHQCARA